MRAARAGDEAELDFRQAAFGRRDGDAVVRGQRDLESASQRRAMHRGDDRLRCVLDSVEHVGKVGGGGRLAEFGNVGAGDEGPAAADDDDRLDRGIRLRRLDAALEAVANGLRQRVHRRGIDRNQGDLAVDRKVGNRIDGGHWVFPQALARRTSTTSAGRARRLAGSDAGSMFETCGVSGSTPWQRRAAIGSRRVGGGIEKVCLFL